MRAYTRTNINRFLLCVLPLTIGVCLSLAAQPILVRQNVYSSAPSTTASWFRSLVQGPDGYFYGVSPSTSSMQLDLGAVFRMSRTGNVQTVAPVAGRPWGSLLLAADGAFYGTTLQGGTSGLGSIYKVTMSGAFQTIHSFRGSDGSAPAFNLVQARDGFLYGVALGGPGCVFRADTAGAVTVLTNLFVGGESPTDGLVEGPDGWLYVTTRVSGSGGLIGRIYRVSSNGLVQRLASFATPTGSQPGTGDRPVGGLVCGTDGYLYGTLGHTIDFASPPSTNYGSVFRMTTNGVRTTVVSFSNTNTSNPVTRLLLARNGSFYGITAEGGAGNAGATFRVTTNGILTVLAAGVGEDTTLEAWPALMQADDGNINGTSYAWNSGGYSSIIWRLAPSPVLIGLSLANGCLTLTWTSFPFGSYQVETRNPLEQTNWTVLSPTITAIGDETAFSDCLLDAPQRLYRISLLP